MPRQDVIATLVQRTAGLVGNAFLRALVAEYADLSGARLVYVAAHRNGHARVIIECRDGRVLPGGEFTLPGHDPEGPASISVPLRDEDGQVIGHVGVEGLDRVPTTRDIAVFRLLVARITSELQRARYTAQLRSREEQLAAARARLVHAIDEERRRIGRDIHDGVQQRTVAVTHLLTLAERKLADDPDAALELVRHARDEVKLATTELRELTRGLHPVGLGDEGLATALEILAARAPVALEMESLPERRLPEPIEVSIFFLVSEALSNAAKHAEASRVSVLVEQEPEAIVARVRDDGRGGADPTAGSGLRGLQDRIATLGGALTVESPPGGGTCLTARIPLAPWRTAREPFLEFGSPDDDGAGLDSIRNILEGRRRGSITVAREWELEGGVPGIGTRLPLRDHSGREHGAVIVERVSIVAFGQVDDHAVSVYGIPQSADEWREWATRRWNGDGRETLAFLFGDPDWHLTDEEPMAILWFRAETPAEPSAAG